MSFIQGLSGGPCWTEDFQQTRFDEDGMIEWWETLRKLRCVQHATPSPSEALGQGDRWRNAQLVAITTGHHATTFSAKQEPVRFRYDTSPPPAGPFGQLALGATSGLGVTANSDLKDEAWKLLKFPTSEETQAFIGQQKRWGVQREKIMDAINPTDGLPEHFADIHSAPWKPDYDGPLKKYEAISVACMGQIKHVCYTLINPAHDL